MRALSLRLTGVLTGPANREPSTLGRVPLRVLRSCRKILNAIHLLGDNATGWRECATSVWHRWRPWQRPHLASVGDDVGLWRAARVAVGRGAGRRPFPAGPRALRAMQSFVWACVRPCVRAWLVRCARADVKRWSAALDVVEWAAQRCRVEVQDARTCRLQGKPHATIALTARGRAPKGKGGIRVSQPKTVDELLKQLMDAKEERADSGRCACAPVGMVCVRACVRACLRVRVCVYVLCVCVLCM